MKKYKIELDDQEINHIKNQLAADIDRYKKAINEAKSDDVKDDSIPEIFPELNRRRRSGRS